VRRKGVRLLAAGLILGAGAGAGLLWFRSRLAPTPAGPEVLVRYTGRKPVASVLADLQRRGVVRDARMAALYARFSRAEPVVGTGTYRLAPGQTLDQVFRELGRPLRQMVRLPETNWAARSARLLERANVCSAQAYMDLVRRPSEFQSEVSFPLPKDTLEGYLYPDTYDLPPLLGARAVIERQLKNFERRVWDELKPGDRLARAVTIGSLVELEVAKDPERPMVAGVVENRLARGMRLQIDAAINYGLQKWRPLTFADYRNVDSPYNLYRVDGLPPTPICSPTAKSVEAALRPAKHPYLFYVALPNGTSLFSRTFEEHRRNIAKRRAAVRAEAGS
jgi:UPF0755 protein